jgi:alpha/beta superfamily hydrolase
LSLEGRLAEPETAIAGGAVLCHPHTLYAGSMSSALLPALQRSLAEAGLVTLRFNFRGAGRSEGAYDRGIGETEDALAALREVRALVPADLPVTICGWSCGGIVALRAAVRDELVRTATAIALPVNRQLNVEPGTLPSPAEIVEWPGRVLLIGGERDDVAAPADIIMWARDARAHVEVIRGADHFFGGHFDEVAEKVLEFLELGGVE